MTIPTTSLVEIPLANLDAATHTATIGTPFTFCNSATGAAIAGVTGIAFVNSGTGNEELYAITPTMIYCMSDLPKQTTDTAMSPDLTISGATGTSGSALNGLYTPTGTSLNGEPTYTNASGTATVEYNGVWGIYVAGTAVYQAPVPNDNPYQGYAGQVANYAGAATVAPAVIGYARLKTPTSPSALANVGNLVADFTNHQGYFITVQNSSLVEIPIASQLESINEQRGIPPPWPVGPPRSSPAAFRGSRSTATWTSATRTS